MLGVLQGNMILMCCCPNKAVLSHSILLPFTVLQSRQYKTTGLCRVLSIRLFNSLHGKIKETGYFMYNIGGLYQIMMFLLLYENHQNVNLDPFSVLTVSPLAVRNQILAQQVLLLNKFMLNDH